MYQFSQKFNYNVKSENHKLMICTGKNKEFLKAMLDYLLKRHLTSYAVGSSPFRLWEFNRNIKRPDGLDVTLPANEP